MKRVTKLTATLLILILAGSVSLNAQRSMRGITDSTRMHTMRLNSDSTHRPAMRGMMNPDFAQGMRPGHGFDRGGRGQFADRRQMMNQGRGIEEMVSRSLPNVTEKQKKDLADLKLKQQDEMKKFAEEMQTRMQAMRDSHRKSMMSILTDEQKKFIETSDAKTGKAPSKTSEVPAKTK
jgi:hypothetical protein